MGIEGLQYVVNALEYNVGLTWLDVAANSLGVTGAGILSACVSRALLTHAGRSGRL